MKTAATLAGLIVAAALSLPRGSTIAASGSSPSVWRAAAVEDLAFTRSTLESRYIYAVYPGGMDWKATYARALARADADLPNVKDFPSYRALFQHFAATFEDPHLVVRFNLEWTGLEWPKLLARYDHGHYLVAVTETPMVAKGAEITACDGKPIQAAIDALAEYEGGTVGLESTDAKLARTLFQDSKNPLYPRPKTCRIGGADVALDWTAITPERLAVTQAPIAPFQGGKAGVTTFGRNGAWIRLPSFAPPRSEQPDYFALIKALPDLRDKDVIVFDVRGNGGGSYNWFMGPMRALWGPDFTSYYARERLKIQNVMLVDSDTAARKPSEKPAPADEGPPPPADPDEDIVFGPGAHVEAAANGAKVNLLGHLAPNQRGRLTSPPPPDPVRARVYVLTDYGCGSACIGFVDEMLQMPGVKQIGRDTYVDRRSGSPIKYPLPSGNAALYVPMMVRIDRQRGDNVPQQPTLRFDGDITDTAAIQTWIYGADPR